MKRIKQMLVIAILAIFAVACTDEDQLVNNTNSSDVNNRKSVEQIDSMMYYNIENEDAFIHNKYSKYEDSSFTDNEMISLINHIDVLIKDNEVSKDEYTINEAVFAMETYFNYAIVNKQTEYDTSSYGEQNFSFNIDLNSNGGIDADQLRGKYMLVVQNILSTMGEHFLQYSDLYVTNKTSSSVFFHFGIPPFQNTGVNCFIRDMVVHQLGETLSIPNNTWTDWYLIQDLQNDPILRFYSKKYTNNFYVNILTINSPYPSSPSVLYPCYMGTIWYNESILQPYIKFVWPNSSANGRLNIVVNATIRAANYLGGLSSNNPNNLTNTDIIPTCHKTYDVNKRVTKQAYLSQMKFGIEASFTFHDVLDSLTVDTSIFSTSFI